MNRFSWNLFSRILRKFMELSLERNIAWFRAFEGCKVLWPANAIKVYVKVLFYRMLPDFWKFTRFPQFVLLVRTTCRWRWVWSIRGMILTGENASTQSKPCPSVTLSTTNLTRTGLLSNTGLRGERPTNNCLSDGTAIRVFINVNCV